MSEGIGIDLGNRQCVVSAVSKTGVKVLVNDLGKIATPAVFGFIGKQRSIGEAGLNQLFKR